MKFITMVLLLLTAKLTNVIGYAEPLSLDPSGYEVITFEGIPATKYETKDGMLIASVDGSSSILMKAFKRIKRVQKVSIQWQSVGAINIKDHKQRITKDGDDAFFRVGLIVSGEAPLIPFFAPAWIKKTRSILKLPSDKMIYLTLGVDAEKRWKSPYSDSIEAVGMESKAIDNGWMQSDISFASELELVGLWLFADGDNTKSQFVTKIRKINLSTGKPSN